MVGYAGHVTRILSYIQPCKQLAILTQYFFEDQPSIDYGNTDTVPLSNLYQLDPNFCLLPVHAICCSLKRVVGEEDNERLEQFTLELQVDVTFTRKLADRYEVKVSKDGVSFKEEAVYYEPQSSQLKTLTPVLNTPVDCTVSYVASCEEFCLPTAHSLKI